MSTRGAIGFHSNGVDKVTYNHYDSYPTVFGKSIMSELNKAKMCVKAMRVMFDKFSMVEEEDDDKNSGNMTLLPYLTESFSMWDYSTFLKCSLFCEWAYIVNLDDEVLEIYEGANKDKTALGRYASLDSDHGYCGVALVAVIHLALVAVIHLDDLYNANAGQIEAVCKYLESKEASFAKKDLQAMTARSEKIESFLVTPPCNT